MPKHTGMGRNSIRCGTKGVIVLGCIPVKDIPTETKWN